MPTNTAPLSFPIVRKVCRICGTTFTADNPARLHCSPECRQAAKAVIMARQAYIKPRVCPFCGAIFTPANRRQRYCTPDCRDRACRKRYYWRHKRERVKRPPKSRTPLHRVCALCGDAFVTFYPDMHYCTLTCERMATQATPSTPQKKEATCRL